MMSWAEVIHMLEECVKDNRNAKDHTENRLEKTPDNWKCAPKNEKKPLN